MRRVKVIGNSGSGKTTFARKLAAVLGLPHQELDEVFWDSDWTMRDQATAHHMLTDWFRQQAPSGWVVDGNWNNRLGDLLEQAPGGPPDAIVWLDYSRATIMSRIIRRTLSRLITRQELWSGNKERFANLYSRDPQRNVILWSWTQHHSYQQQYADLAASDPRVIRLKSPSQAQRWLQQLALNNTK